MSKGGLCGETAVDCGDAPDPDNPPDPPPGPECYRWCAVFDQCAVHRLPANHVQCYTSDGTPPVAPTGCVAAPGWSDVFCCRTPFPENPLNPCRP